MSAAATDYVAQSVEEAGALLGAAITRCSASTQTTHLPPKGMHSSFATISPVPSAELFSRLHSLRAHLKSTSSNEPLVAAPSLLAVLMKLMGVSNALASSAQPKDSRALTPPMLSTPLRQLWVDCVVLCHSLGEGLSGTTRIDVFAFIRNMVTIAGTNPKSGKAAGGTRIAALQAIGGLFSNDRLATKLAPWALDILQLCHRSLRSSGHGEPTFRITAVETACSVAIACRQASLKSKPLSGSQLLVIHGAMEDRAIVETTRMLRHAAADKFPEVRNAAATLTTIMAPMLLYSGTMAKTSGDGAASATSSLEEVMALSLRNLDDEIAGVAVTWAEAVARCVCTCIEYQQQIRISSSEHSSRRSSADDGDGADSTPSASDQARTTSRKGMSVVQQCSTLNSAVSYLVDSFIKVGGELAASRQGGSFSIGGRAVRIGFSLALVKLLGIQSKLDSLGQSREVTTEAAISSILRMVGPDLEKQLKVSESPVNISLDATSASVHSPEKSSASLFGGGRNKSHADAGLARIATSRVLREGLSEMASESMQLTILHELIARCKLTKAADGNDVLTSNQLQVALVEISHLLTALGEAAAASLDDLLPILQTALGHRVHGVRHEAAVVCAAVAGPFPTRARKMLRSSLDDIQVHHAEIMKLATLGDESASTGDGGSPGRRSGMRRSKRRQEAATEHPSLPHQFAIHGHSLMLSILLRELPHLAGGLPGSLLGSSLSVAEILINCQYNDVMTKSNPGASCTCVRAGYSIICGALTVGPIAITPYTGLIFGLWRKVGDRSGGAVANFNNDQDLICIDSALSSVVAFLTHCSELLLLAPDALSSSTLMLEQLLPLFLPNGRLGATPSNHVAASRHESAKASLMEAFAWLPPGSFPMIADKVFAFAAAHIRTGIEAEVVGSILPSLVNNEDKVLDTKSLPRAERCGQVGGARDIEGNLLNLFSEIAHHGERESVLQLQHDKMKRNSEEDRELRGSQILGLFAYDGDEDPVPTPLHSVGTWHEPVSPSSCSRVRLMDAAIQSFSATFGLKDGKEQHSAMLMLESLVPPLLVQLARAIGVDTTLAEPDRRSKTKDDHAAIANIVSVLLACLQALPLHEATHDIPIGLGPPWMNKAKDLLLTLLPSTSGVVRRAAAEGLALLATLGVTEDAHTLQSTVLHSLDEVMQGNQPDGKVRIPVAPVSAARAGSLLTLACIQRTTHSITEKHRALARRRSTNSATLAEVQSDSLPTIQMMTRIIPSVACHGVLRDREAFVVRTYALHSFGLIIAYSSRLDGDTLTVESLQLLKKAVEVVEDNFLAAWTSVSSQYDGGQETDKLAAEASFVAVLLRLMTFLVPSLPLLTSYEPGIGERFSAMGQMMLEAFRAHPVVFTEGMAFFEQLSLNTSILPAPATFLLPSQDYLSCCLPYLLQALTPDHPILLAESQFCSNGILSSVRGARVAVVSAKLLAINGVLVSGRYAGDLPATLFSLLEVACGRRVFVGENLCRAVASTRREDVSVRDHRALEVEVTRVIDTVLMTQAESDAAMLHWILFARCLLTGSVERSSGDDGDGFTRARAIAETKTRASQSALRVFEFAIPVRWQTRCQAARSATLALQSLSAMSEHKSHFDSSVANLVFAEQVEALRDSGSKTDKLRSFVVFHAGEVVAAACSSAMATVDQSELWHVQEGGMRLLTEIVSTIGDTQDLDEPGRLLLEEYLSQIISCVKHGLTAYTEDDEDDAEKLFLLGCEALQSVVQNKLVTDPTVLKRLVRPILLSDSDIAFFAYEDTPSRNWLPSEEDTTFKNFRLSLLPILGKLWSLGRLRGFAEDKLLSGSVEEALVAELSSHTAEVGAYSAAVAIDGSRLLRGSGLSLAGTAHNERDSKSDIEFDAGFLFDDMQDLDELVKIALVKSWPSCACNAMFSLVGVLQSDVVDDERRVACSKWLDALTPIMFAALRDSFVVISSKSSDEQRRLDFVKCISAEEVVAPCLRGLCALLKGAVLCSDLVKVSNDELAFVVSNVGRLVLFPASGVTVEAPTVEGVIDDMEEAKEAELTANDISQDLVTEACLFIESLSESEALSDKVESEFLVAVLTTLDALQRNEMSFETSKPAGVLTSCLKAIRQYIQREMANETLVNAMLQVSVDILSISTDKVPESATEAAKLLMTECLANVVIPESIRCQLAREMATDGSWEAWILACSPPNGGTALSKSLPVVKVALADLQAPSTHLPALSAVRRVLGEVSPPNEAIDAVMAHVGAQVLGLLKAYGTLSIPDKEAVVHRLNAFADCVKIIMASFQQLVASSVDDSQTTSFLSVVFEVLTSVIQFNGLPNQPSHNTGADPTLGRLSAQAIVHVARTSPVAFKTAVADLSDHCRALLEFSVRADMSGYATAPAPSPAKKKLSLQGFKK